MKQINFDSQIMHLHKSPHGTMLKIRSLIGHFFSNSYIFIFQHSRTQTSFPYLLKTSSIYWFSLIFTFNCQNPCITLMFKYDSIYLHPESFLFSYAHHLLQKSYAKKILVTTSLIFTVILFQQPFSVSSTLLQPNYTCSHCRLKKNIICLSVKTTLQAISIYAQFHISSKIPEKRIEEYHAISSQTATTGAICLRHLLCSQQQTQGTCLTMQ